MFKLRDPTTFVDIQATHPPQGLMIQAHTLVDHMIWNSVKVQRSCCVERCLSEQMCVLDLPYGVLQRSPSTYELGH